VFNSFNSLKAGRLSSVNTKMIYPLLRWCSSSLNDLSWCNEVNKYIFFIDNQIALGMLYIGLRDKNTFIKYPKARKELEDKSFELKKQLAQRYYSWSEQEFSRNIKIFEYICWEDVARALGCDKKERKLLGLKEIKVAKKAVVAKKKAAKTLFDF
jgi:hypothetical protein